MTVSRKMAKATIQRVRSTETSSCLSGSVYRSLMKGEPLPFPGVPATLAHSVRALYFSPSNTVLK